MPMLVLAQDMNRKQTLDYILSVYRQVNRFSPAENEYLEYPVGVDSIKLEYDRLVFYYNIAMENIEHDKEIRSATISGDLELSESDRCIYNSDGDLVLLVQKENTAELKRLFYALQHLQSFIEADPFASQVKEYELEKKKANDEKLRLDQERQAQLEREREERLLREEAARERAREAEEAAEERRRQEYEQYKQKVLNDLQNEANRALRGGGG